MHLQVYLSFAISLCVCSLSLQKPHSDLACAPKEEEEEEEVATQYHYYNERQH